MRIGLFCSIAVAGWLIAAGSLAQQNQIVDASLSIGIICYPPDAPYPYKLPKNDPLYEAARDEHQRHLESLESYVNCLDRERAVALDQLRSSFNLFLANFGEDAVLKYGAERKEHE